MDSAHKLHSLPVCVCLSGIVRQPQVQSCSSGALRTNSKGHAEFQCQLSNYSDYVQVVVVEDNRREYNESTRNLSFSCEAHVQDRSQATCTVTISSSAHSGKRDYQLCAGYNDSVASTTPLQCSDTITVTFSGTSGKLHRYLTFMHTNVYRKPRNRFMHFLI